jgi:hypothetical protein
VWGDVGNASHQLTLLQPGRQITPTTPPDFRPSYGPASGRLTRPVSGDGHHAVVVLAQSSFS